MPIYEYRCENCGHQLEVIQKVSEDPLRRCPECEVDGLVKKVSAAGFRLKGGGWYETDFKSGKQRNVSGTADGGADGAAKSSGEKSSTSEKSASKPATGSSKSE